MAAIFVPRPRATRALIFAFVVALAGCAPSLIPQATVQPSTTPELEALGQSWEGSLAKGMAMLIVAGPKIRSGDELGSFRSWQGEQRFSAHSVWSNDQRVLSPRFPLQLSSHQYGNENYVVLMLPAGIYGLSDIFAQLPGVQLNEKLAQKQPQDRGIGTVEFAPGSFSEVVYQTTWKRPTTQQKLVDRWSCAAVIAGTDQCVSHRMDRGYETQVKPGYYDKDPAELRSNPNALAVRVTLKKPLARITLAPGEVVLTDGLIFRLPSFIGFGERACLGTDKKTVRCELNGVSAQTFPANLDVMKNEPLRMNHSTFTHLSQGKSMDSAKAMNTGEDVKVELWNSYRVSTRMHAVIQRAVYKPLQVLANPDPGVAVVWKGLGVGYRVTPATVD